MIASSVAAVGASALVTLSQAAWTEEQRTPERSPAPADHTVACAQGVHAAQASEALLLEAIVNGRLYEPAWVRAAAPAGPHYVQAPELARWGVVVSAATLYHFGEAQWLCLEALGAALKVDRSRLTAEITFPATAFVRQEFAAVREDVGAPVTRIGGGFFNYDVRLDHTEDQTSTQGFWEGGWFGKYGLVTTTLATEQRADVMTRLDTTWRYDDDERMTSFIVGDLLTRARNYARTVRLGGVQFARNFGTRPLFISYPTATLEGTAAVPSTVDVIVNNARAYTTEVAPGPFSISQVPVPTGAGDVQIIVRDLFGQESVSVVPFVGRDELLRAGVADFSYEAGWVRELYGVESNEYGEFAAVGMHRYGVSDMFTLGGRVEATRDLGNLGGVAQVAVPFLGVVDVVAAVSWGDSPGQLGQLAFRRRAERFQIGGSIERRSDDFVDIADVPGLTQQTAVDRFYGSWASRGRWSVNAQWLRSLDSLGEVAITSLSFHSSVFATASLTCGLARLDVGADRQTVVSVSLSMPVGSRDYISTSWDHVREDNTGGAVAHYGRNLLQSNSFGYDALVGETDSAQRWLLRGAYQSSIGQAGVEAGRLEDVGAMRAYLRGGVAAAGGAVSLSRYLDSSFAIVRVADFPDVQLYSNGQPVVRTNRRGEGALPQLTPFLTNLVSFEPNDVPTEGVFADNDERIRVPFRMGALLDMGVERRISATLMLVEADGRPVPAGTTAVVQGDDEIFHVGSDGQVFVAGLQHDVQMTLHVTGRNYSCDVRFTLPEVFVSGTRIGPLTCE